MIHMRKATSLTVEAEILAYVRRTRRGRSRSQRVNELLRRAMEQERAEALEVEAAAFFHAVPRAERAEARAFQRLGRKSLARD